MAGTTSYTLRIPNDLKRLIEIEAAKREVSMASFVVNACWKDLDQSLGSAKTDPVSGGPADRGVTQTAGRIPDMQALRDICAGKVVTKSEFEMPYLNRPPEIPICGKQWWEDGEHYECLMDAGHREQKHGMRGMVRVIS